MALIGVEVLRSLLLVEGDAFQCGTVAPGGSVVVTQYAENAISLQRTVTTHHQSPLGWFVALLWSKPEAKQPELDICHTSTGKAAQQHSIASFSHLDAETRTRSETLDPELNGEISGQAPGEAVIITLHHHGAGGAAFVLVEAEGVDDNDRAHHLVDHHRAQVQAVQQRNVVVNNKGGRGPGDSWRHSRSFKYKS